MITRLQRIALASLLLCLGTFVSASDAQQSSASTDAVQLTGLPCVKENTRGTLAIDNGALTFNTSKGSCDVSATSIQDVVTGKDSQRVIRGTLGTLTMLAPYGAGRAISLLREKIDTITIQYRDSKGGLHGAIFTLPDGKAEVIKDALLAQGAHTTIPSEPESTTDTSLQSEPKEQLR